jgi:homoserine kinase
MEKLRGMGVAASISGAGPTVIALHAGDEDLESALVAASTEGFQARPTVISRTGVE